jgi:HSP20 family protein
MALTDPLFRQLSSLAEEMDQAFARVNAGATAWTPGMDVYETDDDVVVELDVPGVHPEDLNIEVVNGQLVITGERRPAGATRFYRQERWTGRFARTLRLPNGFTGDAVDAQYHDGVLRVALPKPEQAKPRRIQIATGGAQRQLEKSES